MLIFLTERTGQRMLPVIVGSVLTNDGGLKTSATSFNLAVSVASGVGVDSGSSGWDVGSGSGSMVASDVGVGSGAIVTSGVGSGETVGIGSGINSIVGVLTMTGGGTFMGRFNSAIPTPPATAREPNVTAIGTNFEGFETVIDFLEALATTAVGIVESGDETEGSAIAINACKASEAF